MLYNYYFDICALCILATIAITSLSRRRVPAYRQRAYTMLFLATLMATLSERFETYLQMRPQTGDFWYHPAEMLSGSVYFIAHLGSGFFYLMYVRAVLDIYVDFRKMLDFLSILLGFLTGIILVVVNFFTPILFYYDAAGLYHRGKLVFLYYAIAIYYMTYGVSLVFIYKRLMRRRTKAVIISYVCFSFAGLIIQYLMPTVLIENFLCTICITLVYITLQNPSEMVDDYLNILNRKAFLEGLDLRVKRNERHETIFVTIDNIRALSDEIGYSQAQGVLKKIARYLKRVGLREFRIQTYTYRYSESVFAMTIHSKDKKRIEALLSAIAKRLQKPWSYGSMTIKVEGHCFLMCYPDNFNSIADLITKLEYNSERIAGLKDVIVDVKKEVIGMSKDYTNYDLMARNNLDQKAAVIKFQPVLSKIYRINYTTDVLCFFMDEYGNEIDMRGHIPDVRVTQSLMDTDEFVYRNACRALAFWNGGDKNGKYRAIVGMSQGEISRNDFIRRIKRIAREEKAEASWITLKLTETTITTMNSVAERNLRLLGDMKCSIIVDRFGSGYGDLDKILALPVIQVNLDHSILVHAMNSDKMKTVAKGIVGLFHDISLFVGAVDVKSEEDRIMAEELGCDFLVGDYLGRPLKDSSFVKNIDAYFEEG